MNYYEIYAGGTRTGEIVIATRKDPDFDGVVLMTEEEYSASFSRVGRERRGCDNYHQGYDVTTHGGIGGMVALHPKDADPAGIEELLKGATP